MLLQSRSSSPLRWLAMLMVAGCLIFIAIGTNAFLAPCARNLTSSADWLGNIPWVVFSIVGWLILYYRPHNRVGWLCLLIGLLGAALIAIDQSMVCVMDADPLPTRFVFRAWLNYAVLPYALIVVFFVLLIMLFPDGRFLSPRWRNACAGLLTVGTMAQFIVALAPDLRNGPFGGFAADNPFAAVPAAWVPIASNISFTATILGTLLAIVAMILRFRRARGDERQQLKWLTFFVGTFVLLQVIAVEWLGDGYFRNHPELVDTSVYDLYQIASNAIVLTVIIGFPLIIGLTIFKYRLYDIDIIIRRTLQYTLLTGLLALAFFGGIVILQGILGPLLGDSDSPIVTVITTLGIAALFTPLRHRVQDFIDRRFFRQKYDTAQMLENFAVAARDEVDMDSLQTDIVRLVDDTLQPTRISLWVKNDRP